ncbi:hypothetical protein BV898_18316 [Hypsibius exemplaris]|uniref:Obg domain-containing protein n=1 Tax=Hypsibius exemplaris TaxID=2072580 RepID=A0A9X6NH67_HYPEX|nr:hypothetical protein BV898_18316 [Hypsibius exemplaris]
MFCRVTPLVSGLSRAPNLLWNCGNCPGVRQMQHDISLIVLHRDFATAAAATPQKPPSTARPLRRIRGVEPTNAAEYFEDWKEIVVTGGSGGNGICSFLSLPYTEYAGPDGGDGGNGGHVIFEATHNFNSLNHVSAKITGQSGTKGRSKDMHGKSAPPTVIQVPLGTLFRDQNDQLVKELKRKGERFVAARGGAGGRGNAFFKSNDLRAPMVRENGGLGETKTYAVELRVMAHVGLVNV